MLPMKNVFINVLIHIAALGVCGHMVPESPLNKHQAHSECRELSVVLRMLDSLFLSCHLTSAKGIWTFRIFTLSLKLSIFAVLLFYCFGSTICSLEDRFSQNEGQENSRSHNDLNTAKNKAGLRGELPTDCAVVMLMWELKTLGFEISFAFIYFAWSKPHVINM
jgi:hypothetical protein